MDNDDRSLDKDEIYILELEERLEFGAALIDSDLSADTNSGCSNGSGCLGGSSNTSPCVNISNCYG